MRLDWRFGASSDGVSADVIEMVALPALHELHGMSAVALSPQQQSVCQTVGLWWVL